MDLSPLPAVMALALLGGLLGTACALVPGLHINTLALVLLALSSALSSFLVSLARSLGCDLPAPVLFAVLLVSTATTHSFVDFLPSTFLGVPDGETSLTMLPAHRLLLAGKGLEAIQCAATGSLLGALLALLAAVPLQIVMRPPFPTAELLVSAMPFLLIGVVLLLILTERGGKRTRTYLDARKGEVLGGMVSISYPVPVQGRAGTLSGRLRRRGLRTSTISTPCGEHKVLHRTFIPKGHVLARGTWIVRPDRFRGRLMAASVMCLSGLLGLTAMNARPPLADLFTGMGQSPLFPLLSGLFAFPALLSSLSSGPIPPQEGAPSAPLGAGPAFRGVLAGFLSGWLPGITSTIGATIGSTLSPRPKDPEQGTREYIVMLSAVGTSAVVFSVLALAVEGKGRTGAMLVLAQILGDDGIGSLAAFPGAPLSYLLMAMLVATALGYLLTLRTGAYLARRAAGRDLRHINILVLSSLMALVALFNGLPGLLLLGVATLVGLLPPCLGVRRVHLTGCLLLPLILFYFGLEDAVVGLLW